MANPLLSIVIPTHNRPNYAIFSILSILSIDSQDLELIVTDTSVKSDLEIAVSKIKDARLVYRRLDDPLSMIENHNLAMSLATGEYVCLIGDDDTITQEALSAARWASTHGIGIVSPFVVANYAWPDFKSKYLGSSHASRLYIRKGFGKVSLRESKKDLLVALKRGALGTEGLPKIYHGIVRKEFMETIKARSGAYFHGTSPDVSGAVSLAIVSDSYIEIDYPLTLPGASGKSNTGRSALKKHKGTLENDPHTKRFKNLDWPSVIPRFTSVETVWAQSVYQTLKQMEVTLLKDYNLFEIYAACLLRHQDYRSAIMEAFNAHSRDLSISNTESLFRLYLSLIHNTFYTIMKFIKRAMKPTAAGGRDYVENIPNIQVAQTSLAVEISRRKVSFDKTIELL
jgi:glycosyltransferase involved in cell wall biosynthesis